MRIVERLRRKTRQFPTRGGGSVGIDANGNIRSSGYTTDDGYRLANPDGPEAAALLKQAEAALEEIVHGSVFNQQRFAEDTDTDYFLRCFKAVKERANGVLAKLREGGE